MIQPEKIQIQERQALLDTIYVIGGKWRLMILRSICDGNSKFAEIERSIPGITARMLSRELKAMELNEIISREAHAHNFKIIAYRLTDYSKSFAPVVRAMIEWGISHREKMHRKTHQR